jgi:hypothetical protein
MTTCPFTLHRYRTRCTRVRARKRDALAIGFSLGLLAGLSTIILLGWV